MDDINKQNLTQAIILDLISWHEYFELMSKEYEKMETLENAQGETIFPAYAKILSDFKKLDQTKRHALCCYGCEKSWTESKKSLLFYKQKPDKQWDEYYCGCYGKD